MKTQGTTHAGPPAAAPAPPAAEPSPAPGRPEAAGTAKPGPFHTAADSGDPVYHDSSDCPYGQEIRRDGNDRPGTGGRRRCDWCAKHAVRA